MEKGSMREPKLVAAEKIEKQVYTKTGENIFDKSRIFEEAYSYLDDETTDEEFEIIVETEQELKEKTLSYGHVIKRLEQAAGSVDSEIEFLTKELQNAKDRKKRFQNKADRIKRTLLSVMKYFGIKKIEGLWWKGKADIVNHDEQIIVDLKTTSDITKFRSSAFRYNYDSQAYIYRKLFGYDLVFIAIDKKTKQIILDHYGELSKKDDSESEFILATNDLTLTNTQCIDYYKQRWNIEVGFKHLKSNFDVRNPLRTYKCCDIRSIYLKTTGKSVRMTRCIAEVRGLFDKIIQDPLYSIMDSIIGFMGQFKNIY